MRFFSDPWDSYFIRDTRKNLIPTLKNKLGIHDFYILSKAEYAITYERMSEILFDDRHDYKTFDASHVKTIHAHLFQDIYKWAGQYRTVEISKRNNGTIHSFAPKKLIDTYLERVSETVKTTDWAHISRQAFVEQISKVFAYLNQAHPFREGNGRTARVFLMQVAELSPFELRISRIDDKKEWNLASAESAPPPGTFEPRPEAMHKIMEGYTFQREIPGQNLQTPDIETKPPQTRQDLAESVSERVKTKIQARQSKTESQPRRDRKPPQPRPKRKP